MEFGNIVINETQTPGLDQVTLFNVRIAYIDLEKARQAKGVELNMDPYGPLYTTESGESFFSLKIKSDPNFNQLYFHHSEKEKGDRNCGDITITPTHVFGENVNNMSMYDLLNHIEFIRDYAEDVYGIVLDFSDAGFKKMEINTTIILEYIYACYNAALKLLFSKMPKGLKAKKPVKGTMEKGNDQQSVKAYDKKNQMIEKLKKKKKKKGKAESESEEDLNLDMLPEMMRIEQTLKKPGKIKKIFGTNKIYEITDRMIAEEFGKFYLKNMRKPFMTWRKEEYLPYLEQTVQAYWDERKVGVTGWWRDKITEFRDAQGDSATEKDSYDDIIFKLIDVEDLIEIVQKGKKDKTGKRIRDEHEARIIREIQKCVLKDGMFTHRTGDRINEIMKKIEASIEMALGPDWMADIKKPANR